MGELRERIAQAIMAEDLLQDERARNGPDYCSVDARVDAVMAELSSWESLMSLLDDHYPPEVFDGSSGDEGPRTVALVREVDRLRRLLATHRFDGEMVSAREAIRDEPINQLFETAADYDRERGSRQAWAEEAMRLQHFIETKMFPGVFGDPEPPIYATVCACVADEQAAALPPGFSRPVCAVHPEGGGSE